MDGVVVEAADAGRADAGGLRFEIEHLPDDARLPEQMPIERRAELARGSVEVRDHAEAEEAVGGDVLVATDAPPARRAVAACEADRAARLVARRLPQELALACAREADRAPPDRATAVKTGRRVRRRGGRRARGERAASTTARPTALRPRQRRRRASQERRAIDRGPAVEARRRCGAAGAARRASTFAVRTGAELPLAAPAPAIVRPGSSVARAISSMNVHCTCSSLSWLARPYHTPVPDRARRERDRPRATAEARRPDHSDDAAGLFAFRVDEVLVAIEADQRGDVAMRPGGQQPRRQPERGRDADGGERVAEVVLAVAERALAVLPRLAPVDRRQRRRADVRSAGRMPSRHARCVERAAPLERVASGA